ncbi:MAG: sulfatase-like hydrolase/transferase, partial [Planctomycetales bacterium]|nr:sulfatase-like hydrolase/transferase [Planctomycetales bacterium]
GSKWWTPQRDWRGNEVTGYRGWIFQSADGREKYPDRGVGLRADISRDFADAAIQILEQRDRDRPFFIHVNFTAPHDPLLIPEGEKYRYQAESLPLPPNYLPEHPFDHGNLRGRDELLLPWPRTELLVRQTLAAYYSVVTHLDEQVGRILAALRQQGLADNTLVIYTSDHGLAVGSHGLRGKQNMYEHTIGVPLLIAGPGVPAGESLAPIYLRDLYPTVCELTGTPLPNHAIDGVSHADVLRGEAKQHHDEVYGYFRTHQRMIRRGDWKLIHYPQIERRQLFHLADDPHELKDLSQSAEHREQLADLSQRMERWFNEAEALSQKRRERQPTK